MRLSFGHARTRARDAIRVLRRARHTHDAAYAALVSRFVDLYARRSYSIAEIQALDLLDPRLARHDLDRRQSKETQLRLQLALNPREYFALTEDKAIFHVYCLGAKLSTPRQFGVVTIPSRTAPEAVRAAWRTHAVDVFSRADAPELIVKPTLGVYGQDISVIQVVGSRFARDNASPCTAEELFDSWAAQSTATSYVVQERLQAHSEIARLSGTRNLQTIRMVSYVRGDGRVVIGCCQLRIIAGEAATDNFRGGRHGNLVGDIPRAEGVLTRVFGCPSGSPALVDVSNHPLTGVPFQGFRVPRWAEACRLVEAAAQAFSPLRTIGWDVAVTDHGVFLIEGNVTWDPAYEGEVGSEILDAVLADAPEMLSSKS